MPESPGICGVYLLISGQEIVYVGSSSDVRKRVAEHTLGASPKTFDRVLFLQLPLAVNAHYEGALIRALWPRYCLSSPKHAGYDNEILEGLGLRPHADERKNAKIWLKEALRRRRAIAPSSPRTPLAREIAHWRRLAQIEHDELAIAVGEPVEEVAKWEIGDSVPTAEQLDRVLEALPIPEWAPVRKMRVPR